MRELGFWHSPPDGQAGPDTTGQTLQRWGYQQLLRLKAVGSTVSFGVFARLEC